MAQAKKKTATKTAKKATAARTQCRKKACTRTAKKQVSEREKMHIYAVTGMSILAGVLLAANAAMMIV
ncbi:hypothetical protein IKE98_03125 [Candidatus Saccharibacteria bacterium]|nr:hypothetical protein [Candidatus Saccharibacteria bacterium]